MSNRGAATRQKILDAAQQLILEHGYSQASVDRVLERTGLTKGAFFYHFRNKVELTKALIDRYAADEAGILGEAMRRGEILARDPLQQLLVTVGILIEDAAKLADARPGGPPPGCLFGSYAYEMEIIVPEVHEVLRKSAAEWQASVRRKLDAIAATRPPRNGVDLDDLASGLLAAYEGGFIIGRMLKDPHELARQLRNYRTLLELSFAP